MKAYKYNSDGLFIGEQECQLNPIATKREGKEIWLLPALCTFETPLDNRDGYNIVWNGSAWEYVEVPAVETPQEESTSTETAEDVATEYDKLNAQVMYTALMTDTLLDEDTTTESEG